MKRLDSHGTSSICTPRASKRTDIIGKLFAEQGDSAADFFLAIYASPCVDDAKAVTSCFKKLEFKSNLRVRVVIKDARDRTETVNGKYGRTDAAIARVKVEAKFR